MSGAPDECARPCRCRLSRVHRRNQGCRAATRHRRFAYASRIRRRRRCPLADGSGRSGTALAFHTAPPNSPSSREDCVARSCEAQLARGRGLRHRTGGGAGAAFTASRWTPRSRRECLSVRPDDAQSDGSQPEGAERGPTLSSPALGGSCSTTRRRSSGPEMSSASYPRSFEHSRPVPKGLASSPSAALSPSRAGVRATASWPRRE
jgi:hypothetical protein